MRRDQDYVNTNSDHRYIMLAAMDTDESGNKPHPFWYAEVLGIYHAETTYRNDSGLLEEKRMDFLWVRWFGLDAGYPGGIKNRRLERIGYIQSDSQLDAFGFVNPADVIRACHLIPAFSFGRTTEYLGRSAVRKDDSDITDWHYFYVNL